MTVGGLVERELSLSLDDLRARPATTLAVTMECAGNGRARLEPRPVSQPWLLEAVGTAEWTGVRLADLLDEAGVEERRVEVLFRGLDRGVEGGEEQQYERSLTLDEARRDEVLLAYAMNGAAAAAPARVSAAAGGAGLVRDDERQVARGGDAHRPPVRRLPAGARLPPPPDARRARRARRADRAAVADDPARDPGLRHPRAPAEAGGVDGAGPRVVGIRRRSSGSR